MKSLLIFLVAFLTFSTLPSRAGSAEEARPPLEIRRMAEQHSVVVRTKDLFGQIGSYGLGLIVAEEGEPGEAGGRYTIMTAGHVIRSAGEKAGSIAVRPYQHIHWIEASLLGKGDASLSSLDQDYAFLEIMRDRADFKHGAFVSSLSRSPAADLSKGDDAWALGYDQFEDKTIWAPAKIESADKEHLLEYSAKGVREGFSGGIVVNRGGALGMSITAGSDGRGCAALTYATLGLAADKHGVAFGLAEPLLAKALRNCLENGLLVSLCEHPRNRWIALSVDREETAGFAGRWMTYGMDGAPNKIGTQGTWSAKTVGERLLLTLAGQTVLTGPSGEMRFTASTEFDVAGHMLLAAKGEQIVTYLAIPRGQSETVAVRFIDSCAQKEMGDVQLAPIEFLSPKGSANDDTAASMRVGDKNVPMAVYLRTKLDFGRNTSFRMSLALPASWLDSPVSLSGRFLAPDGIDSLSEPKRSYWRKQPIQIRSESLNQSLVQIDRDRASPNDFSFRKEFDPKGRRYQINLTELDPSQNDGIRGFVLQGLVLSRETP